MKNFKEKLSLILCICAKLTLHIAISYIMMATITQPCAGPKNRQEQEAVLGFLLKTLSGAKYEIDKLHINGKPISYRIQQYQFHAFSLTTRRVFAFETFKIDSFENGLFFLSKGPELLRG